MGLRFLPTGEGCFQVLSSYTILVFISCKVLIKNLAIFLLFPCKEFLPISFKIQLLDTSPQKQKEQRKKQLGADKIGSHTNLVFGT
jgi:hypothetical protein